MVYIAMDASGKPVRKQAIAQGEGLSAAYVEQILIKLRSAGLVESRRGTTGGYVLGREAGAITVNDIVEAMEGPIALVACSREKCGRIAGCVTQSVWERASATLRRLFSETTVASLAVEARSRVKSAAADFHI